MNEAFIEWVDDGTGRVPVFFDRRRNLVDVLHDYVQALAITKRLTSSSQGYASTINAVSYALLGWLQLLDERGRDWESADDALLLTFAESQLAAVQQSRKSKGNERIAKRTINVKLQWIYRFYCWAQKSRRCKRVIGPKRPITSTITLSKSARAKSGRRQMESEIYPCCYRGVSGSDGGPQHFATAEDKRRMQVLFATASDPFLTERNRLMLELTDRVGWRAGTITGLLIDDFNEEAIQSADDEGVIVTPAVQKRGYRNSFPVPHTLVARVVRYMVVRHRWLVRHGWGEQQAQRYLFISGRTGQPLGQKTLVQLVGRAFRAVGVPAKRGAGHHSFRRKFSDESTKDDLQARKLTGHSTAVEDVMHATALRLGQRRIASQAPYQRAVRDGTRDAEPHQLRHQVQELEATIADQQALIAELRRASHAKPRKARKARVRSAPR